MKILSFVCGIFLLSLTACNNSDQNQTANSETEIEINSDIKPFKVLVIIDEQWTDPLSYHIDTRRVEGEEFIDVVSMLTVWGIPFDILRLDEQRIQINRFLDGLGGPKYGCMIWMADPNKLEGNSANYAVLKKAVEEYNISMIALFDNIKTKEVADLVGVNYLGLSNLGQQGEADKFSITGKHYITAELGGVNLPDINQTVPASIPKADGITTNIINPELNPEPISIVNCSASESVSVLGMVGENPQFVVRDVNKNTKAIWIGGGKDWFRTYPVMREVFRKSLVYAIGYGVFNDNFENGFIFIMDDIGCSEHAYSLKWHYPTPSKETLMKYLIEPLEERGLMMVQFITPAYANPQTKMIENAWTLEPFTDIFGNYQDFGSTKEGLDEGLKRGIFEIQPHRAWSHMNWDLESEPGSWWDSEPGGEREITDWYNEVVDVRRGAVPVPSNDLLFIYKSGIDAVKKAFGVVALAAEVRPLAELREGTHGGDDNGRVAAIAGLGVSRECYVSFDRTVELSMMMPDQFTCHDLDLTEQTDGIADVQDADWDKLLTLTTEELLGSKIGGGRRINLTDNTKWIDDRMDKNWMGFNECSAYMHTKIAESNKNILGLEFSYDNHYCQYFGEKTSRWTLELADYFLENMDENASIYIDGTKSEKQPVLNQVIEIPAGIGSHSIEIIGK